MDFVMYEKWISREELREAYESLPDHAMRVGPGTDAVVWKVCDTNETVEL
jgi:hypothetical protein